MSPPRVFISYSHDSRDHCQRVLQLAQQLRRDGIAAELDQFHEAELLHWPRWCEEQMREDNADFVLCICTAEYRRRVEGQVPADVGRGVFWEGTFIYNELYHNKGNGRCLPALLGGAGEEDIPRMLKSYTWFRLKNLGLKNAKSGYANLYRLLTRQVGVQAEAVGTVVRLPPLVEAEVKTDFIGLIERIHAEQVRHEQKSKRRHALLVGGLSALLLLVPVGFWGSSHWTAQKVTQEVIDPAMIGERLRSEIRSRFECDADAARREGKNWEAIRELERNRDAALVRVDDVVASISEGLSGNSDPIFSEASRILEQEGSDAALAYLESHKADLLARADRAAAQADAAQARLKQELQPLLLQANLRYTRQDWSAALALLQTVADKAPTWWGAQLRLGTLLNELARFAEAESHLRTALILATDEKDQALAGNELVYLLQATNRLTEAEPLMRRALSVEEKKLGLEHPVVAIYLNNLAQLLLVTNRFTEAEPLIRRALAIGEKSYGPGHPKTAIYLNNLAWLLQATNRRAEAEPLMQRALVIFLKFTRANGHEHPHLWDFISNYRKLLQAQHLPKVQTQIRLAEAA